MFLVSMVLINATCTWHAVNVNINVNVAVVVPFGDVHCAWKRETNLGTHTNAQLCLLCSNPSRRCENPMKQSRHPLRFDISRLSLAQGATHETSRNGCLDSRVEFGLVIALRTVHHLLDFKTRGEGNVELGEKVSAVHRRTAECWEGEKRRGIKKHTIERRYKIDSSRQRER